MVLRYVSLCLYVQEHRPLVFIHPILHSQLFYLTCHLLVVPWTKPPVLSYCSSIGMKYTQYWAKLPYHTSFCIVSYCKLPAVSFCIVSYHILPGVSYIVLYCVILYLTLRIIHRFVLYHIISYHAHHISFYIVSYCILPCVSDIVLYCIIKYLTWLPAPWTGPLVPGCCFLAGCA